MAFPGVDEGPWMAFFGLTSGCSWRDSQENHDFRATCYNRLVRCPDGGRLTALRPVAVDTACWRSVDEREPKNSSTSCVRSIQG